MSYPNLQFDPLVVPVDGFDLEVDADGADECRRERVVSIAEQEAGLSHAAVPDDQDLKHVIKGLIYRVSVSIMRLINRRHLREKQQKRWHKVRHREQGIIRLDRVQGIGRGQDWIDKGSNHQINFNKFK